MFEEKLIILYLESINYWIIKLFFKENAKPSLDPGSFS